MYLKPIFDRKENPMKRILIALLLLVCLVLIQGQVLAQLTVQDSGISWMDGDDGVADPNQPAPDGDEGGGDE
jgi:hypothetical protein